MLRASSLPAVLRLLLLLAAATAPPAAALNVLIIGGTRFSGAALWRELHQRGHSVTLYNRGKTPPQALVRETPADFAARLAAATMLTGDRQDPDQMKQLIDPDKYDYVYDMNARSRSDTQPLAELFANSKSLKQYVFMSSAGVYHKSDEMPHLETDATDPKSRHLGKLESERALSAVLGDARWCSFRPTYICGPGNYNPLEAFFLERVAAGRPVCIPGHGQHLTGLGHVDDLAVAMANVVGREAVTGGRVYNLQNSQAITFDGVARTAARVMGRDAEALELVHYNPKDFEFPAGKKAFPMRPVHFFCGIHRARVDLDWTPRYDSAEAILRDAYENDFVHLQAAGKLKGDFECDDMILGKVKAAAAAAAA